MSVGRMQILLTAAALAASGCASNSPFAMRAPTVTQPSDAVRRWREDVAVARAEFLEKDRSFSPARRTLARDRLDRLAQDIPALSDQEIVAELARVAALADNGHTRAYLLRNRGWWRRYPIRIWKFSDGWRILAVRPGQEALLGARLVSIAGKPIGAAEAAVRLLYGGPATWGSYMATYTLTSPDALLGTGVIRGGDGETVIGVEKDGQRFTAHVMPMTEPRRVVPEESWWFLAPAHPAGAGWRHVLTGVTTPAYLDRPDIWYELRRCRAGLLYFKFSRSEDQPGRPPLAEFGQGVLRAIAGVPQARLVVDLRFNTGGNLQKTRRLFEQIADSQLAKGKNRLFVILGPSTFSAGITPAAILRKGGEVTIVGSEPGDRMHFWAEGGNVLLPNSGITLHYADRAHLYSARGPAIPAELVYLRLNARGLKPVWPAPTSFSDYLRGRDPAALKIDGSGLRCDAANLA